MRSSRLLEQQKRRVFEIIEISAASDVVSRVYDVLGVAAVIINLTVSIMCTFDSMLIRYEQILNALDQITVAFFAVDYALRLWTARYLRPDQTEGRARLKYITSFTGLVDLLSFLPDCLPVFFPSGAAAFRMLRVIRVFRLFRINRYYDSLSVITAVISSKRQQLISSVYIIVVLMLAASLCMYSLEHQAQPDVFTNAFSGIWWTVSTVFTVGYGDIYPITVMGQIFGIIITFLGVGMVAIPTGIISAGFVEQYSRIKRISEMVHESDIDFIKVRLNKRDVWVGKTISEIGPPHGMIVAAVQRKGEVIVPRGDVMVLDGDVLVLGAVPRHDNQRVELKEIVLREQHPWNGQYIRDLDISRQTVIVMVKRGGQMIIPKGDQMLMEGDKVVLYTQKHIPDAKIFQV